ncbi:MAG: D-alanyl-D-alanine carboxypeptidase family protein [Actinomycetota bacterium]
MTVVAAGLACALSLLLASFGVRLGETSARAGRAQVAADAAALAAVAEAGPYGRGLEAFEARRFAAMNGARLLECRCPDGATAVQVEVEVAGVVARARAVLEPSLLFPAAVMSAADGLDPRLAAAVQRLVQAAGGRVRVVSGFRDARSQQALWAEALARYGSAEAADDWVAPPGRSMHERGLAVDLGGDLALAAGLVTRLSLPLHRPLAHEPWHFELVGSRSGGASTIPPP